MLSVKVVYNPYFVETEITVNGTSVVAGSPVYELCRHERLQNWVDKVFPLLREEYREKKFEFSFTGTIQDAEDFKDAMTQFQSSTEGVECKLEVNAKEMKTDRVTALRNLFESGKNGPFAKLFKSEGMQAAFDRAVDPTFEANVIATMSSGKSTVVNSLLGLDLMPAKNEACTATIARITDHDGAECFVGRRFGHNGELLSDTVKVTNALLMEWNDDPKTSVIEIDGDIPTVDKTPYCRMVFVDTPGPNNSRNDEHKKTTYEAIEAKPLSMVLYVLNSTQLSTTDDEKLLRKVNEVMGEGGRQAQDRFVFIANKIDAFDPENGESVTKALKNVRDYLRGFGIENPLVIPASAYLAKLLRKSKAGQDLSRKESNDLRGLVELFTQEPEMNMLEHVKSRISGDCYRRLQKRLMECDTPEEKAEILSGIPIVEELLNDFLQKHALPAKLKDAVDSLERVMAEAKIAEKKQQELEKGEAERSELLAAIRSFNDDKRRIEKGNQLRADVKNLQYRESKQTLNKVNLINAKAESLCERIASDLEGDEEVAPREAKRITRMAVSQCRDFDADVVVSFESALREEQLQMLKEMRDKYQAFVEQELKRSFPKDSAAAELQACAMQMPSIEEMVSSNMRTERVKVGSHKVCTGSHEVSTSTWYKPWTWGSSRTVYEYDVVDDFEDQEKVNIVAIIEDISDSIRSASMTRIEEFRKQARKVLEEAKEKVLAVMDEIDAKVAKIQDELEAANSSKDKLEDQIADCRKQVAWINKFRDNLNEILAV